MVYSPDARGLAAAREAIARYYRELGPTVAPDNLFLTAHTSEAYTMLFKLLADPGDEILVPSPGYPLLAYLAGFESLQAISYPLRYDEASGWFLDLEILQALITPRTRAVVAVNPNNPTGSYLSPAELSAWMIFAAGMAWPSLWMRSFQTFISLKPGRRWLQP